MAYSVEDLQADLGGADPSAPPTLVNEKPTEGYSDKDLYGDLFGDFVRSQSAEPILRRAEEQKQIDSMPKSWWGEARAGFSRGIDQLQQTAYGVGALAADALNFDTARDFFAKGVEEQNKQIAEHPGSVESHDQVDNFDSFMRYVFGSAGEVAPNLIESVVTGLGGALVGSAAGPEGTVTGGVGGFIARKAARELVKRGVKDVTEEVVKTEAKKIASKYGAMTALGLSSWGQETGGIYNDMAGDPNIAESDRKLSAVIGGFIAAAPETFMEGWITSKFFKGVPSVTKPEVEQAKNYVVKFMQNYGKEIMKVVPGEGGQEFAQTVVEEAAKNWADPNRRDAIFSFNDEQKKQFIDATFKGAIGGAMGGGVAAHAETRVPQHPNPEIRTRERDTMARAEDLSPPIEIAVGESDERLSAIGKRRDEIQAQLNTTDLPEAQRALLSQELENLDATENEILGDKIEESGIEPPLVNENPAPTEAPKESKPIVNEPVRDRTPLERAIGHLRAFYAKEMPIKTNRIQVFEASQEQRAAKSKEIESLVNEIGGNDAEYTATITQAFTPDIVNMMAAEDVKVQKASDNKDLVGKNETFAAFIRGDDIVLAIPNKTEADKVTEQFETTGDVAAHEAIHIADLVQIRDKWRSGDQTTSLEDYEVGVMKERGVALRKASPSLPTIVRKAYNPEGHFGLSDRALGQEFTRMMVEFARTGKLTEATQALVRTAQAEEQGTITPLKAFLAKWMQAIRDVHDALVKMFDPRTAPPQLVQAFHQIDTVLDKYGVLVNEKVEREVQPIPTPESTTTPQEEASQEKPEEQAVKEEVPHPVKPSSLAEAIDQALAAPKKQAEKIKKRKDRADAKSKDEKKRTAAKANVPRTILGPALLNPDGSIYKGRIGQTHAELKLEAAKEGLDFTEAQHVFHDSLGNTLTRREAYSVAARGQLNDAGLRKASRENPELESQDLITPEPAWREEDRGAARANRPNLTARSTKIIESAVNAANKASNHLFAGLQVKEAQRERVKGEIPFAGATPQQLYYTTRPHTQSAVEAQRLVNENGGALNVAEGLQEFPMGDWLNLQENDNEQSGGPNAKLKAVYENVLTQLVSIEKRATAKEASSGAVGYLRNLRSTLEERMRRLGNDAGAYNAYTGMSDNLITGETARKEYVQALVSNADKVISGDAKVKLKHLSNQLNDLWQKYSGTAANHPKVIATIRRIAKLVNEKNFAKGYRQTVVKSLNKLKELTKRAAARAADHMAMTQDEEAYMNRAIQRVASEMTGVPKAANTLTEHQLVLKVLSGMARQVGREMGVVTPSAKEAKISTADQMAAVLRNESLYAQFTQGLYEAYVKEYGGVNPEENTPFIEEAEMLYARLANRMWQDDMVTSLVNEKMQELNMKFADIVKQQYSKGQFAVEKIRAEIAAYMKQQGVTNDSLIDQLAQDIENEMTDNIEAARGKFFTSKKTIKDFLRSIQTTLSQAAREHSTYVDSLKYDFAKALETDYGFPNTPEIPAAAEMAHAMQQVFNEMVKDEREKIIKRWMEAEAKKTDRVQSKKSQVVDQILALANTGALTSEKIYQAIAPKFDLPPYSEETALELQELGDQIGEAQTERQKWTLKQKLADLLTQKKGMKTSDSYTSWMYFSMLSGIGTPLVNIGGNLTTLMGYVALEAIKHPSRIPRMINALVHTAIGKAQIEFRESFFTGMALGKQGEKYYRTGNPAEVDDPYFKSRFRDVKGESAFYEKLAEKDEALAKFTHKLIRTVKGQYVGRFLMATDMFFYKIAEEAAYASRVTDDVSLGTPEMWESAMYKARSEMEAAGQNPDDNADSRRRQLVLAHSIHENLRLRDSEGNLVNERVTAWTEANSEALDATFAGEPKYFLGFLAKHIERFTNDQPIGKLLIPFTRVAANVTNHMLEWTPYGFARYALLSIKEGSNPFKLIEDGHWKKESDIAVRAALGTASIFALLAMAASDRDDEDPDFTIYGDGPRDFNQRRMMMEKGWKPNTVKIGNAYFSYLYTPLAMALAIVGRHLDDYRDGRIVDPRDISLATSSVALIEAVKNQSFLASVSDLMAAVDSPDPQAKVSKVFARIATIPIPNILKQVDRWVDPSLQQAQGFAENWVKELPIARHTLKPALNVFGKEISRTQGFVPLPGIDRFVTEERTDDPVLNVISQKNLKVPGISKTTRLGDAAMTKEQFYDYVQLVGPRIYERYQAEVFTLQSMSREDAQERIERISQEEKKKARAELMARYNISR